MKTLFVAIALMLGISGYVNAQNSKIAHIATQELLESLPKYQNAKADVDKLTASYDAEIKSLSAELQRTMEQYGREAETKTDEENLKRQNEVESMRQNIVNYRRNAFSDLQKKEEDLYKPIYEEVRETIQKVARGKGYQYVLDSTTGTGLLLADGYDLMPDVKKALGI